jgi:hypothetical protein
LGGYSLGMKQRLGIAAALLNDPRLLLLDEPSNGLDPAGIVAMRDTLRNLADAGKTVFVSSHLLGEVQQMVDVIGIISAGRLVREGPIDELLSAGGMVRVRVDRSDLERAIGILAGLAGAGGATASTAEPGWISVGIAADRIAEVNRVLAQAGIWATGLESGNDLEQLFLELTGGEPPPGGEGTFFGVAGAQAGADPGDRGVDAPTTRSRARHRHPGPRRRAGRRRTPGRWSRSGGRGPRPAIESPRGTPFGCRPHRRAARRAARGAASRQGCRQSRRER